MLFLAFIATVLPSLTHAASQSPLQHSSSDAANFRPNLTNALLALHKSLIQTPSVSCNEVPVTDLLSDHLRALNFSVELQRVSRSTNCPDHERYNIYAYPSACSRHAPLLLTSHIDTVPPFLPYSHDTTTDIIAGRGAVDAKGSVAVQITALTSLLAEGIVSQCSTALLYVSGEELGGDGMKAANSLNLYPQAVIFGEPSENRLVSGHKGITGIKILAKGVNGHSGYPETGVSANELLVKALGAVMELVERDRLPRDELFGRTTVNMGLLSGGTAPNVIAPNASAELWLRLAAGTPKGVHDILEEAVGDATREMLREARERGKHASVDVAWNKRGYEPVRLDDDVDVWDEGEERERFVVNYGTDVPNLQGPHKKYLYGPGTILVAHSDREAINVEDLKKGVEGNRRLIVGVLKKLDVLEEVLMDDERAVMDL